VYSYWDIRGIKTGQNHIAGPAVLLAGIAEKYFVVNGRVESLSVFEFYEE
jgi:hypothetical protein